MESFSGVFNAQMVPLVYLAVGIYCMEAGFIDREIKKKLAGIILRIILPCMTPSSFNKSLTPEVLIQTTSILVVAVTISILSSLLGKVIYSKYPQKKKNILQYCTLINSPGFLGTPIVSAVYGNDGPFATFISIIPNRIFMWTVSLAMFITADLGTKCRNISLNPCIVIVFLGIVRGMTESSVSGFLDEAVANIGAITAPLPMMMTGTMLIRVLWKELLKPSVFYLTLARLITSPLVILSILNLIHAESMLTGISLILVGIPAGSTSTLLVAKYGVDEDYAPRYIVTTIIMPLATIPALMLLL